MDSNPKNNKVIRIFAAPVHAICHRLQAIVPHNKHVGHVTLGGLLMVSGSGIAFIAHASCHGYVALEIIFDTFAYGLHGLGAAPIVKLICDKAGIEV